MKKFWSDFKHGFWRGFSYSAGVGFYVGAIMLALLFGWFVLGSLTFG